MSSLDERNDQLEADLEGNTIDKSIATLTKAAKRQKIQILVLALSVALDLLLTVGLIGAYQKVETNTQAIKARCEQTNASRANNKELWTYLLSVPPDPSRPPRTAGEQAALDAFAKKVDSTFAPTDCTKVLK